MDNILYIDDESNNLVVFEALLSDRFNVFVASNTTEGSQILANEDIAVVITDHRMPEETGLDFIVRIQPDYPDIVFMILSGFADFDVTIKAINSGFIYRFMQKPWLEQELIIDINNALERYKFLKQNKQLLIDLESQNDELKQLKGLLEEENSYLKTEIKTVKNFDYIISEDEGDVTNSSKNRTDCRVRRTCFNNGRNRYR